VQASLGPTRRVYIGRQHRCRRQNISGIHTYNYKDKLNEVIQNRVVQNISYYTKKPRIIKQISEEEEKPFTLSFSYLCTYDLYGPVRNVFDACRSIARAVGRGWALESESFLGPVQWHRVDRRVPFHGGPKAVMRALKNVKAL
jgi:hypothetical protein